MLKHRTIYSVTASVTVLVVVPVSFLMPASPASADPLVSLTSAVETVRSASQCSPLQSDPLVVRAAQIATQETADYVSQRSSVVPFTDPMPALKTIGYTGSKGLVLSSYNENGNEIDAVHGLMLSDRAKALLGTPAIANCAYTRYGTSAVQDQDTSGVFLSLVLAGA